MTATLLGCPHCRKPIGSVPRIAGQPVSCPYCRRPFQMPGLPELPAKPDSKVKGDLTEVPKEKPEATPTVHSVSPLFDPFRATNLLASRIVFFGSVAILLAGTLVALEVVAPLFISTSDHPAKIPGGIVGMLLVVTCCTVGITALFLVRSLIRVGVETVRSLRPPEPASTAEPKSK